MKDAERNKFPIRLIKFSFISSKDFCHLSVSFPKSLISFSDL